MADLLRPEIGAAGMPQALFGGVDEFQYSNDFYSAENGLNFSRDLKPRGLFA